MAVTLVLFSGAITLALVIFIIKQKEHTKYKRLATMYVMLFFSLFSVLLVHNTDWKLVSSKINAMRLSTNDTNQLTRIASVETMVAHAEIQPVTLKDSVLLDAPIIAQYPELPRGCEVTSLAMLLQDAGVKIDKMTLAKEVKKDPTPYKKENGKVYFGNPYKGFVGDMYTKKNPGYGVYHGPIADLATHYLPARIIDFTGSDFDAVKMYLSNDTPVWVVTNAKYQELPIHYFQTWHTKDGLVKITYQEHSVLVTGYDENYIYFNDPLTGIKNKKAPKQDFIKSWVQMGSQAITYIKH